MGPTDRDMLKLIEAMDALVRLIVIMVFTTTLLRVFMSDPKSSQIQRAHLITINEEITNGTNIHIDKVINIPVQLTAFDELVQSARPAMQRLRDLAKQRFEQLELQMERFQRQPSPHFTTQYTTIL